MPRIFTILNFRVSIDSSSRKNDTKTTTKFCLHLGWKKQKLEKTKSKNKRGRISCISSFFHDEKDKKHQKTWKNEVAEEVGPRVQGLQWEWQGSLYQLNSMKIIENQWKWAAAAGDPRGCGGGIPPQQLLAGPAAGDPGGEPPPTNCWQMLLWGSGGGVPPLNQELRGSCNNI